MLRVCSVLLLALSCTGDSDTPGGLTSDTGLPTSETSGLGDTGPPANRAPTIDDETFDVVEDTAFEGALEAEDADGDVVTVRIDVAPRNGEVVLDEADGTFTYVPDPDFAGVDGFEAIASDGELDSEPALVTLRVGATDDRPVLQPLSIVTDEDVPFVGQLAGSDADGDPLTYAVVTDAERGEVTLVAATGALTYVPDADYFGSDTLVVQVSDGIEASEPLTVDISVLSVNDAPVVAASTLSTIEEVPINGIVSFSDPEDDTVTLRVSQPPSRGSVLLDSSTGAFVYTPDPDLTGIDSFEVIANDGSADSVPALVTIDVGAVNDGPRVVPSSWTTPEDTPFPGQLAGLDPEGDPLTYQVETPPQHGALQLDAQSGAFTYTPDPDFAGSDAFDVTATDGLSSSPSAAILVEVTPVNDPPVVTPMSLTTDEDTEVVDVVVAVDPDSVGITFRVTGEPSHGQVSFDGVTGSFVYTPDPDRVGPDSFDVVASDGLVESLPGQVSVDVQPINDAPQVLSTSFATDEDTTLLEQIVAFDVDGDPIAFAMAASPQHGQLVLSPTLGSFSYVPDPNYFGPDSFSVFASDGVELSAPARFDITVLGTNDPPAIGAQTFTTPEDVPVVDTLMAFDLDGDSLVFQVVTSPAQGSVALDPITGAFTYTPPLGFAGQEIFEVTVDDGTTTASPASITIDVFAANDPPVVSNQMLAMLEDATLLGQVIATDPENDPITYGAGSVPSHGSLTVDPSGTFTYVPDPNFFGFDSFDISASDLTSMSFARIDVTITNTPDVPIVQPQQFITSEDTPLSGTIPAVDPEGDPIGYRVDVLPTAGTVSVGANGSFTYVPAPDYTGPDSFVVVAFDQTGDSAPATFDIVVTPQNDPPVSAPANFTVQEDAVLSNQLVGSDVDGDPLTYQVVAVPSHGTLQLNAVLGTFTYTPSANFFGVDTFDYTVNDGFTSSPVATVTVTVTAANDPPVVTPLSLFAIEDQPLNGAVFGVDVEGQSLTYSVSSGPTFGTVVVDPLTGLFTYTPNPDANGVDQFAVVANDGFANSAPGLVTISVSPVNDAPVGTPMARSTNEDTPLFDQLTATDVESDPITYALGTGPSNGSLSLSMASGGFTYTPNANFFGADSFSYTASDGSATSVPVTVDVFVLAVNDPPVLTGTPSITVATGQLAMVALPVSDIEMQPLNWVITVAPTQGAASVSATGDLTYTSNAGYTGPDSVTVSVSDGAASTLVSVPVTVTP